jgi:hypothetical protein
MQVEGLLGRGPDVQRDPKLIRVAVKVSPSPWTYPAALSVTRGVVERQVRGEENKKDMTNTKKSGAVTEGMSLRGITPMNMTN